MEETPLEEGWIKHVPGDPCPCEPRGPIEIKDQRGSNYAFYRSSEILPMFWRSDYFNPIIAWRPIGWEYKPEPQAPKCGEWYPIETAPKDGSRFLAMEGDAIYSCSCYADSALDEKPTWYAHCGQPVCYSPEPTHWTPLPSPPQP